MVLNVISPAQAEYIPLAEDLEKFLVAKFGQQYPNFDFKMEVTEVLALQATEHTDRNDSIPAIDGSLKLQKS
jgi:disulfide oxidoreductase YuzD